VLNIVYQVPIVKVALVQIFNAGAYSEENNADRQLKQWCDNFAQLLMKFIKKIVESQILNWKKGAIRVPFCLLLFIAAPDIEEIYVSSTSKITNYPRKFTC
jgi:F0F1-type ATP synthase membrane subunit a